MRDSPWFHQKRSESAPPVDRVRDVPSITQKEQDDITARISRPTESALYRQSLFWKLDGFMDRGFHSWSKMELFDDCKRCMWCKDGAIKRSCKIRPLRKSLPPLAGCRVGVKSCDTHRSVCSDAPGGQGEKALENRGLDSRLGPRGPRIHGSEYVRVVSRGGSVSRARAANHGVSDLGRQFGLLSLHRGWTSVNGNVSAGLAVPRIESRPVAVCGQRV